MFTFVYDSIMKLIEFIIEFIFTSVVGIIAFGLAMTALFLYWLMAI